MAYFVIGFVFVDYMRELEVSDGLDQWDVRLTYRTPIASAGTEQTPAVCVLTPAVLKSHTVLIVLDGKNVFSVLFKRKDRKSWIFYPTIFFQQKQNYTEVII